MRILSRNFRNTKYGNLEGLSRAYGPAVIGKALELSCAGYDMPFREIDNTAKITPQIRNLLSGLVRNPASVIDSSINYTLDMIDNRRGCYENWRAAVLNAGPADIRSGSLIAEAVLKVWFSAAGALGPGIVCEDMLWNNVFGIVIGAQLRDKFGPRGNGLDSELRISRALLQASGAALSSDMVFGVSHELSHRLIAYKLGAWPKGNNGTGFFEPAADLGAMAFFEKIGRREYIKQSLIWLGYPAAAKGNKKFLAAAPDDGGKMFIPVCEGRKAFCEILPPSFYRGDEPMDADFNCFDKFEQIMRIINEYKFEDMEMFPLDIDPDPFIQQLGHSQHA